MRACASFIQPLLNRLRVVPALLAAGILLCTMVMARAERLALVIGNSAYQSVAGLANPVNDARLLDAKLSSLGFDVTALTDVDQAGFWQALEDFTTRAATADIVLFYFSGHAFQVSGVNYLVPVDARLQSAQGLGAETWILNDIIARLEALNTNTVVMLDACRNNPLPAAMQSAIKATPGLARIESGADTKVVFATQPNMVAYEGTGDVSFFTQAVLDHIDVENQSLDDLIRKVRNQVRTETLRRQVPWSGGNLAEAFYFKRKAVSRSNLTAADLENLVLNYEEEDRQSILRALAESLDLDTGALTGTLDAVRSETSLAALVDGDQVSQSPVTDPASDPVTATPDAPAPAPLTPDAEGRIHLARVSAQPASRVRSAVVVTRAMPPELVLPVQQVSLRLSGTGIQIGDLPAPIAPNQTAPAVVPLPDLGVEETLTDKDLARAAQAELDRLGCYTDRIDGIWGRNSRFALSSYYLAKGIIFTDLKPHVPLLRQLQLEPSVICTGTEPRAPRQLARADTPVTPRKAAPKGTITHKKQEEIQTGNTFIGIRLR